MNQARYWVCEESVHEESHDIGPAPISKPHCSSGHHTHLSYRRMDAAAYAGRLFDHLGQHFGPGSVFRDIDTIRRGEDFAQATASALNASDVVLVIIGNTWATGQDGLRRLDDPEDWVRLEVAAALRRNVLVVPVLVDGARIQDPATLPEELRPLCRRHACELSDLRWSFDVGELVKDLREGCPFTQEIQSSLH
jgi:hypothetical protein